MSARLYIAVFTLNASLLYMYFSFLSSGWLRDQNFHDLHRNNNKGTTRAFHDNRLQLRIGDDLWLT